MISWILSHPGYSAAIALGVLAILSYIVSKRFRFWVFDTWMDFPLIGRIPFTLSRMTKPSENKANRRMDKVFRGYRKYIDDPPSEEAFVRAEKYVFICGDSGVTRNPGSLFIPLILLLSVEAYGFSFLLAFAIAPDSSEDFARWLSIPLAIVVASLLAWWGHVAGHSRYRAHEIKMAQREAIDEEKEWPEGEKPKGELIRRIRLSDDQDSDLGRLEAHDAQRFLNRVRKTPTENPSYATAYFFLLVIIGLSGVQYRMRMANNAAEAATQALIDALNAAIAAASGEIAGATADVGATQATGEVTSLANIFLIAIFLATQAVAFWIGYRHTLLGPQSKNALKITRGHPSYAEMCQAFESLTYRADESLMSLLAKLKDRYPGIHPDGALYLERLRRAKQESQPSDTGQPPAGGAGPPPPGDSGSGIGGESNVHTLSTASGGADK